MTSDSGLCVPTSKRRWALLWLLPWAWLLVAPGRAAVPPANPATSPATSLTASLAADRLRPGQPVLLRLQQPAGAPAPDLSPLQADFHLTRQEQIPADPDQQVWELTLIPRRSGQLTIPALQAGAARSEPLTLLVADTVSTNSRLRPAPPGMPAAPDQPPATPPLATIDAHLSRTHAQVGEQVILRLSVRAPTPPFGQFVLPELPSGRLLLLDETQRDADAGDGVASAAADAVLARRYALFPTSPGSLEIPPVRFAAWGASGGGPTLVASAPLTLEVAPAAPRAPEQPWLPATDLSLSEAGPSQVRLAPGQAISRLITLRAEGLPADALPALPLGLPAGLRVSAEAPRLWNEAGPEGVIGFRTERVLIIAEAPGEYRAEPVTLRWWRPTTGTWEEATLPAWELTVAPLAVAARRQLPHWLPLRHPQAATAPSALPLAPPPERSAHSAAATRTLEAERALVAAWVQHRSTALLAGLILIGLGLAWRWRRRRRARPRAPGLTRANDRGEVNDPRNGS